MLGGAGGAGGATPQGPASPLLNPASMRPSGCLLGGHSLHRSQEQAAADLASLGTE